MRLSEDRRHALNAICPYFTMFPLEFPLKWLKKHRDARVLLDPFCGRGTSLYAARAMGIRGYGIDCSRVAVAISQAKLTDVVVDEAYLLAGRLVDADNSVEMPDGPFWRLAYHQDTLRDLCKVRTGLLKGRPSSASMILRGAILGIMHGPVTGVNSYLSN